MSNEFWAAIIGAVVGSVSGGLITYLLQLHANRREQRLRADEKRDRDRGLAHALLYKLIAIYSDVKSLSDHVEGSFAAAAEVGGGEPWQVVKALANHPADVTFTTDEMSLAISLGNEGLFNGLLRLDQAHNSLIDVFDLYSKKREEISRLLPVQAFIGQLATTALSPQQMVQARPLMIELNSLIDQARPWAKEDAAIARKLLVAAQEAFATRLGLKYQLQPSPPMATPAS